MLLWFQVHDGWWSERWQNWGLNLCGILGLFENIALHFVGKWGDLRPSPSANFKGLDPVLNFFQTEALPFAHMRLLFSLKGFLILSSLSQRASSDKVPVWVLSMSDDEKKWQAVRCEWKSWLEPGPQLLVFGKKKLRKNEIRLWKSHPAATNSV